MLRTPWMAVLVAACGGATATAPPPRVAPAAPTPAPVEARPPDLESEILHWPHPAAVSTTLEPAFPIAASFGDKRWRDVCAGQAKNETPLGDRRVRIEYLRAWCFAADDHAMSSVDALVALVGRAESPEIVEAARTDLLTLWAHLQDGPIAEAATNVMGKLAANDASFADRMAVALVDRGRYRDARLFNSVAYLAGEREDEAACHRLAKQIVLEKIVDGSPAPHNVEALDKLATPERKACAMLAEGLRVPHASTSPEE